MLSFIVLGLIATAVAAPGGGYQYPNQGFASPVGGGYQSQGFVSSGSFGGVTGASFGGGQQQQSFSYQQQAPIVTKHFHSIAAAEESEADVQSEYISGGPSHKHYRVVFIKAPSQTSRAAALQFAQAANEEKTVIYVLSKKTDASELAANVQQANFQPSRPEVHFIKYRTQEEAAHAQQQIQSQYDGLGGSSQFSNEGVAPVTSVIGSLGQQGGFGGSGQAGGQQFAFGGSGQVGTSVGVENTYLPPNKH